MFQILISKMMGKSVWQLNIIYVTFNELQLSAITDIVFSANFKHQSYFPLIIHTGKTAEVKLIGVHSLIAFPISEAANIS